MVGPLHLLAASLALFTALLVPGEVRAGDSREVARYDTADNFRFDPVAASLRTGAQAPPGRGTVRFEALGRRFALQLESNEELVAQLPARARARMDGIEVYRGYVEGADGSWVRVTRVGEQWAGLFWDGSELLAIEPESGIGAEASSGPIVYRAADAALTGTCGSAGRAASSLGAAALGAEAAATAEALPAASILLNVAVLGDEAFSMNEADPMGLAVALFNAVDGIYSEQVGVAINVVDIDLLEDDRTLRSSDPDALLEELKALAGSAALDNPGLVHLLTGRNLDGATVGVAFVGSLCEERSGVGLSEIRGSSFASDTILIAHEMGHNFGAPHDNEPGPCSHVGSGFIMNPTISASSNTFSTCSLDQMDDRIAVAQCIEGELDPCLSISDFSGVSDGFLFRKDSQTPKFTSGSVTTDALRIDVGGVNKANVNKLLGYWEHDCRVDESTPVRITLNANLTQATQYDAGEKSKLQIRIAGDKTVLARFEGDGKGGEDMTTGVQAYIIDTELPAGNTRLRLECANNRKTSRKEVTRCEFERLEISAR